MDYTRQSLRERSYSPSPPFQLSHATMTDMDEAIQDSVSYAMATTAVEIMSYVVSATWRHIRRSIQLRRTTISHPMQRSFAGLAGRPTFSEIGLPGQLENIQMAGVHQRGRVMNPSGSGEGNRLESRIASSDNHDECVICLEKKGGRHIVELPCFGGHTFHRECFQRWSVENNSCPICRSPISR